MPDHFDDLLHNLDAEPDTVDLMPEIQIVGRVLIVVVIIAMFAAWWFWGAPAQQ